MLEFTIKYIFKGLDIAYHVGLHSKLKMAQLLGSLTVSYVAQQCIFEDQDTSRHRINGYVGPMSFGYAIVESSLSIL